MKLSILAGSTSQTVNVFIRDSSSSTGAGLTGLAFDSASLTAYYMLPRAAAVSITLATQTVTGAFSSGGFVEISSANAPGWYRLDIPDAALASGRFVDIHLKGAANMAPLPIEIELTGWNNQDGVRGGLTALPNAAANANGGLPILSSSGTTLAYTLSTLTTYTGDTPQTGDSFARIGATGSGLTSLAPSATALSTAVWTAPPTGFLAATFPGTVASTTNITAGTITTVTNLTNLPSIPANWLTSAGIASGALDSVWNTAARTLTAGTNIQLPANGLANVVSWTVAITGNITGNLSGSVGSVTGNVATVGGIVPPTAAQIDTQLSGVHGAGAWGGGGSGSGAYTITVTVTDGTDPLQNALVRVTEGINTYTVTTGALGTGEFALDAATYDVAVTKGGYEFTPTTRTVTGNEAGTLTNDLELTATVIPAPSSPNLCTVAMTIIDLQGNPLEGYVITFTLYAANARKDDDNVVALLTTTATSDADGLVTLSLIRTDYLSPSGAYYTMSSETVTVPTQQIYLISATKQLADIIV